jgi:chromosomal replication initiation ATPase DnaA
MEQLELTMETCALVCDTTIEKIKGKDRFRKIVVARQIYCFIARKYFGYGLVEIANTIKRDHTTVMHSVDLVDRMLKIDDPIVCEPFYDIIEQLNQRMRQEIKVSIVINGIIDPNIILNDIRERYNCIIQPIY